MKKALFLSLLLLSGFANATATNPAMLLKGSYFVMIENLGYNTVTVSHEERFIAYANNAATCEARKEQLLLQPVQVRSATGTNDLFDKVTANTKSYTKYSTLSCELLAPVAE